MPEVDTTRVKLRTGGVELEYEGSESFLRSDLPKFVDVIAGLRIPSLGGAATALNETIKEFFLTMGTLGDLIGSTKADINSMSELSEHVGHVPRDHQEHQIVLPLLLIPVLFWRFVLQGAIGRTFKILELA
jgi:hypothetical protein